MENDNLVLAIAVCKAIPKLNWEKEIKKMSGTPYVIARCENYTLCVFPNDICEVQRTGADSLLLELPGGAYERIFKTFPATNLRELQDLLESL